MKQYRPVSANATTTSMSCVGPFYTVPAGRTAKLTYVYITYTDGYLKINNDEVSSLGTIITQTNIQNVATYNIYLKEGDSLYFYATGSNSIFVSLIEEYEA